MKTKLIQSFSLILCLVIGLVLCSKKDEDDDDDGGGKKNFKFS